MVLRTAFIMALLFCAAGGAAAQEHTGSLGLPHIDSTKAYIRVLGVTRSPIGWIQFCEEIPQDCVTQDRNEEVILTKTSYRELLKINNEINHTVQPMSDLEHYGVVEKWAYPDDGKGDCEDYVLQKRRALLRRGWPMSALLITVVRDHQNEGHAILTVHTNEGDLILDNMKDEILAWNETGYHFVKRQSQTDVNVWVSLPDNTGAEQAVATGR